MTIELHGNSDDKLTFVLDQGDTAVFMKIESNDKLLSMEVNLNELKAAVQAADLILNAKR